MITKCPFILFWKKRGHMIMHLQNKHLHANMCKLCVVLAIRGGPATLSSGCHISVTVVASTRVQLYVRHTWWLISVIIELLDENLLISFHTQLPAHTCWWVSIYIFTCTHLLMSFHLYIYMHTPVDEFPYIYLCAPVEEVKLLEHLPVGVGLLTVPHLL